MRKRHRSPWAGSSLQIEAYAELSCLAEPPGWAGPDVIRRVVQRPEGLLGHRTRPMSSNPPFSRHCRNVGSQSCRQDLFKKPRACRSSSSSMRRLWARPAITIVTKPIATRSQIMVLIFPHSVEKAIAPSCFETVVDLSWHMYRCRFRLICRRFHSWRIRRPFQLRSRQHRLARVPALSAVNNPVGPACPRGRERLGAALQLCLRRCQWVNPDDASCNDQRCSFHRAPTQSGELNRYF
jgi:hypothetical protein